MTTAAIIVAAGRGTRAGGDIPKQWQLLGGKPAVQTTIDRFASVSQVDLLVLVVHPDDKERAAALDRGPELVTGGETRNISVRNALEALDGRGVKRVLIHDGARPLVSSSLIIRMLKALENGPAAAPALAVTDALWRGSAGNVIETQDRTDLFRAQTPQAFHFDAILAAHRSYTSNASDDVEVARAAGLNVQIIDGDDSNLKLTYPQDFARAERLLKDEQMDVRVGNGFDVHAFCPGNHVWLCGVKIPHDHGLLGHSDADVGMHALTDAIYGALALGDIGRHFPPSDPQWKGAESHIFLTHAMAQATNLGYTLANADITLICERPKIGPHAAAMIGALARFLGVAADRVSVKATTSERLGFTGREEGIAAMATATLVKA